MRNAKLIISIILMLFHITVNICLDIEHENLWSKQTSYKSGSVILENILFVNSYLSVEYYSILANGELEFAGYFDENRIVCDLQIEEAEELLYVHFASCAQYGPNKINAYQIIDGEPVLSFSSNDIPDFYSYKDFVYPVGDYVIFNQPNHAPCYNKQTGSLESINYPYQEIIGAYNDVIIEYNVNNSDLNFYKVIDINQPLLLYQYNYNIAEPYRTLTRCFDNEHCLIIDKTQILVFNIAEEQNINYQCTWTFPFVISNENLKEPVKLENDLMYFGSAFGDSFIYDVSDYNSPVMVNSWFEEDYEASSYCIYESNWLYRTMNLEGIWKFDLNNMPTLQHEEYGYSTPSLSAAYFEGSIYRNDWEKVFKIDAETQEEEIISVISLAIGWEYYKFDNLLIIENGGYFDRELTIIDLNSNQIVNQIPLTLFLYLAQNGRFFFHNSNVIEVYEINDNYELIYLTEFSAGDNNLISVYDEDRIWISYSEKDFLFNSVTLEIDHDFEDFFSPNSIRLAVPCQYDDRLLIKDNTNSVRLFDISNLDDPVLLDTKTVDYHYSYFLLEDFILENYPEKPVKIYQKFGDSFTAPLQEYDFDTLIFDIKIDEDRHRIITSSYYYFETYLYEPVEITLNTVPESAISLSNHPNPFNPSTEISFQISEVSEWESAEIIIYNIKGQKVKTLPVSSSQSHTFSLTWDGTDRNNRKVSSGVYLYQLHTDGKPIANRKMMLLK